MIISKVKRLIWMAIHKNRRNPAVARFARLCKNIHRASEHPGYDSMVNGERDCILRVISSPAATILDIGANVGDWSAMCQKLFPQGTIHAFELSPKTAQLLQERFHHQTGVHAHAFGLSSIAGEVPFFSYEGEASVLSSLRTALFNHAPHTVEKATVITGDQFCEREKIGKIDYLKIDAEGFDYEVLIGFKEMLTGKKINAVQFEHQGGRYIKDFYDILTPLGYTLGKLYANYVDFRPHDPEMEHFLGPNYIAVRSDLRPVIDRLKKGW